ncbi:hypothetical protein ACPEIF_29935 [Streptomyces sp. NPDC012600]|uniref:hypothetical protein n=1 Tax=Streptomyces sp. NPDC012600 TaxID=3415005 RepID=UPI003C30B4D2
MRPEHCVTRNHIEVFHKGLLPSGADRIRLWMVLCGSFLPILVWTGIACFAYFVYNPVVAMAIGGLFALFLTVGFGLRRRARHSVRCSAYGALGGVFDKSLDAF